MTRFQQILLATSLLMLLFFIWLFPIKGIYILAICMQLQFLVLQNAKYISNNMFRGASVFRNILYYVPYSLALFLYIPQHYSLGISFEYLNYLYVLTSISLGILMVLPGYKSLKLYYNKKFACFMPPVQGLEVIGKFCSATLSAFIEEIFHKLFIISLLAPKIGIIWAIIVSSFLFMGEHAMHFSAEKQFKISEYFSQFFFGIFTGWLYVVSGSVIFPIITHLIFNYIIMGNYVFRYFLNKRIPSCKGGSVE